MPYTKFSQLVQRAAQRPDKTRCAVVSAEDEFTIEAVIKAMREGLIFPILIGDKSIILELLADNYCLKSEVTIIDEPDHEAAAQAAIDPVNEGKADCIMKGLIKTNQFMHAILKRENNLRTGELVSMLSIRRIAALSQAGLHLPTQVFACIRHWMKNGRSSQMQLK